MKASNAYGRLGRVNGMDRLLNQVRGLWMTLWID